MFKILEKIFIPPTNPLMIMSHVKKPRNLETQAFDFFILDRAKKKIQKNISIVNFHMF